MNLKEKHLVENNGSLNFTCQGVTAEAYVGIFTATGSANDSFTIAYRMRDKRKTVKGNSVSASGSNGPTCSGSASVNISNITEKDGKYVVTCILSVSGTSRYADCIANSSNSTTFYITIDPEAETSQVSGNLSVSAEGHDRTGFANCYQTASVSGISLISLI